MACPPGRIQIRRDTLAAWQGNSSVILAPGELAFAYPDANLGYPNGILKIGLNGGSSWANSTQIFPSSGSGGGTPGPTGPQGLSAYQFIAYNGTPTITYQTSTSPRGYNIVLKTSSNDQTLCVNPELFNVNVTGVVFSCILPDTTGFGGTSLRLGFGESYASITSATSPSVVTNQIKYWVDEVNVQTLNYTPGSTLSVVYDGKGGAVFTLTDGASKTVFSTTTTTTTDYVLLAYDAIVTSQTTTITGVNVYTLGLPGPVGPTGPTGPQFAPTTLTNAYNITIQSVSGSNITITSSDMRNIIALNQQIYLYFVAPPSYSNITNGGLYYIVGINRTNNTIQISGTSGGSPISPT
jgi:hypothetical protein